MRKNEIPSTRTIRLDFADFVVAIVADKHVAERVRTDANRIVKRGLFALLVLQARHPAPSQRDDLLDIRGASAYKMIGIVLISENRKEASKHDGHTVRIMFFEGSTQIDIG